MFGAFRPTNSLSGGLLWYGFLCLAAGAVVYSALTTIRDLGRYHGDSPNSKKHDNGNVCELLMQLSRLWIELWLNRILQLRLWRGGSRRCRLNKRCYRRTNTLFSTGKRRSTERAFTVGLPTCNPRLCWVNADSNPELPKWTRLSQRINPPGY
jgi:hypothetical protein